MSLPINIEAFMELVHAKGNDDARRNGVQTIGQLRSRLTELDPSTPIVFEDGRAPTGLCSYRGYYDRLSIERDSPGHSETRLLERDEPFDSEYTGHYHPGSRGVEIVAYCTAGDLIAALDLADGGTFEGWKGGQYLMDAHTFVHVGDYGDCGPFVSGVRLEEGRAVVETEQEEW